MPSPHDNPSLSGLSSRLKRQATPIFYFSRNPLSMAGVVLATSTFFTLLVFYLADFYGAAANPYIGIVAYLALPGFFLLGLVLIPLGMALKRSREVRRSILPAGYPRLDFNRPELRRVFRFVVVATALNVMILLQASYHGVRYMDSAAFCGQTCHSVMEPEFTAYQNSSHSRVSCVSCHIGPGASWFVRSKLSGMGRVIAVGFNTFPRPIPTSIADLRPARETCEQCHWPSRFSGSLLAVLPKFAEDETNTASQTVLMLKVGGGNAMGTGVHSAHLDLAREITYLATDQKRQQIPWVRYRSVGGQVREYAAAGWDGSSNRGELRVMDCMDCHNRPTHTFQLPAKALDEALASGRIDDSLPFVKKKGMELLRQPYASQAAGEKGLGRSLLAFYRESYPEVWNRQRESVERAAQAVQAIYRRNVFPEMRIGWGTYPNNMGHVNFPGCFRCHDGNHESKEGATITQDCNACHVLLAIEEENPEILERLSARKRQDMDRQDIGERESSVRAESVASASHPVRFSKRSEVGEPRWSYPGNLSSGRMP